MESHADVVPHVRYRLTGRDPVPAPRSWTVAVLLSAACSFAFAATSALANPIPYAFVYVDIRDPEGDFCTAYMPVSCDELVQTTDRTGMLEFDIVYCSPYGWGLDQFYESSDIVFTMAWSQDWQFVEAQACGSGIVGVAQEGNHATFSIQDPHGVPASEEFAGLGRVILNVTGEGSAWFSQEWHDFFADWAEGRAGVSCGTCVRLWCDHYGYDTPELTPRLLELTADATGAATGSFHVDPTGYFGPDTLSFHADVPWISLDLIHLQENSPRYDVTVHADAAGLSPGVHEATIEVSAQYCYECERVILTVLNTPVRPTSWGSLKRLFRP
jgi:hypothetical protein